MKTPIIALQFILFSQLLFANEGADAETPSAIASFMPIILIFAICYFLLIRPQSKKMKEHKLMLGGLKLGDKVITNGGIHGIIRGITDAEVKLEIATDVKIDIQKDSVSIVEESKEKSKPSDEKKIANKKVKKSKKK